MAADVHAAGIGGKTWHRLHAYGMHSSYLRNAAVIGEGAAEHGTANDVR